MVYKYTTKSFKFIDQYTKIRQHFLVLDMQIMQDKQKMQNMQKS